MTLACIMRFMPAMPMADSRPAMVVGIRQTSRAISTVMVTGVPACATLTLNIENGSRVTVTTQEDDGQRHQQDRQGDLVGGLLPLGAFDHRDHAVEEGLARIDGDADDDPVGQHAGAAGDGREVAARLADHRGRFAGDGRFVHRGHALDDLAVGRDGVTGVHHDDVALAQIVGRHRLPLAAALGSFSFLAEVSFFRPRSEAACALLRPSASASAKLAKSTVNHSHSATARMNSGSFNHLPCILAGQGLNPERRGQDAADVDDEHHRVAPLHGAGSAF